MQIIIWGTHTHTHTHRHKHTHTHAHTNRVALMESFSFVSRMVFVAAILLCKVRHSFHNAPLLIRIFFEFSISLKIVQSV